MIAEVMAELCFGLRKRNAPGYQPWAETLKATRSPDMVVRLIEQAAPLDELDLCLAGRRLCWLR